MSIEIASFAILHLNPGFRFSRLTTSYIFCLWLERTYFNLYMLMPEA